MRHAYILYLTEPDKNGNGGVAASNLRQKYRGGQQVEI